MADATPRVRSLLFAPGCNARILAKVFDAGSDAVDLDLEDAVPASLKHEARTMVRDAVLERAGRPSPLVVVRVNGPASGWMRDDLEAIVQRGVWAIHFTKLRDPRDLTEAVAIVDRLEAERGLPSQAIRVISSVDSAHLALELRALVRATPRMYAVIAGGVDFAEDLGIPVGTDMVESLWARSHAVLASREAGLRGPLHPPGLDLEDDHATATLLSGARRLGFQGAIALHPKQLPVIHEVFAPTAQEVAWAAEVVEIFSREEGRGTASIQIGGRFVDYAVVKQAERILAQSDHALAHGGQS
jgi:citrate lyase subunit beta / citryl-CoA lyase